MAPETNALRNRNARCIGVRCVGLRARWRILAREERAAYARRRRHVELASRRMYGPTVGVEEHPAHAKKNATRRLMRAAWADVNSQGLRAMRMLVGERHSVPVLRIDARSISIRRHFLYKGVSFIVLQSKHFLKATLPHGLDISFVSVILGPACAPGVFFTLNFSFGKRASVIFHSASQLALNCPQLRSRERSPFLEIGA